MSQAATTLGSVSGTAAFGGTATLTATLTSQVTNAGASGRNRQLHARRHLGGHGRDQQQRRRDLDRGDNQRMPWARSQATWSPASPATPTTSPRRTRPATWWSARPPPHWGASAGTATFGSTATLTATLTSSATNAGVAGETVSFTLDGTSVGTAVTNSSGVATLTGVATTDGLGTDTGGVVASFAGDTDYVAAANATGNLVVTQGTSISSVSGTSDFRWHGNPDGHFA